ncbi:Histone deacetylase domain family protein [Acanthocheilonema viteae]
MFGYVYDDIMQQHASPYDPNRKTQERPERTVLIHSRLQNDGLLKDAINIKLRAAEDWELCLNHPYKLIKELEEMKTVEQLEEYCKGHELLWLCPDSVRIARLVVGGVIDFVQANIQGRIGNGFAIVRPPGHHSYGEFPQGFCIFNNVAICAKYAVLVVDSDYHCGNGLYHSFKGDNRFLYINFHAYHYGAFWPYEEEYDYDNKYDNIISIPLNCAMNTEGDYIGALRHLVIPIAQEYQPELVLVALGFDSAYYDDLLEHGQGIKAHGYGHIMKILDNLWPNKILAILEGGYFSGSYTECAAMAVRGLRRMDLPKLQHPKQINACMTETLWNSLCFHAKRWKNIAKHLDKLQDMQIKHGFPKYVPPSTKIFVGDSFRKLWNDVQKLKVARTRDWISGMSYEDERLAEKKINEYIKEYEYGVPTDELTEDEFLKQLLWYSQRRGEAFLKSIPTTLFFYNSMRECMENENGVYLIIDMYAYREAAHKCGLKNRT